MVIREVGCLCAENQNWNKETIKQLKNEYNILYDGTGCYGFEVIPREQSNPLIRIYSEDDGTLYRTNIVFDIYWIKSFIKNLLDAENYAHKLMNKEEEELKDIMNKDIEE